MWIVLIFMYLYYTNHIYYKIFNTYIIYDKSMCVCKNLGYREVGNQILWSENNK